MRWLRKWRRLTREEKRLWREAFIAVILVRVSLWLVSFNRIFTFTERYQTRHFGKVASEVCPRAIGQTVSRVARRIPQASCLTQAIAARLLLARRGHKSALRFGGKQVDGELEAHAWVEVEGVIVVGRRPPGEFASFRRPSETTEDVSL